MNKKSTLLLFAILCFFCKAQGATISIAITSGTNPSCANSSLTFTETAPGLTNPSFVWFVNGLPVGTGTTYTTSAVVNGDVVTAKVYYTNISTPDSALSNAISIIRLQSVTPSVSIAMTSGINPGCTGQPGTFTATPVNGGTAPVYQWKLNGVIQPGVTGNTFTAPSLANGNTISAVLTSNQPCAVPATATSNTITFTVGSVTPSAFIFIQNGSNPTCVGKPVTFKAVVTNGGTAPTSQWRVNNVIIAGATGITFTTSTLNNGDSVQYYLTSNSPCVAPGQIVKSNAIHMTILPYDTVKVSAAITQGSNPGCKDSVLKFTATGTNGGASPLYAWFVNGAQVATGATYTSSTLNNGDVVRVRIVATGAGCHVNDTAYSTPITLTITTTLSSPVISFIGTMLVSDSVNVQWYGPGGIIPGATSQTYHPTSPGSYYAVALPAGCVERKSNVLLLSLLSVSQYDLSTVHLFPNPTSGQLVIDWGSNPSTTRITVYTPSGQAVLQDIAQHAFRKTLDLSSLANGVYFVVLQDESGKAGTVRIMLAK